MSLEHLSQAISSQVKEEEEKLEREFEKEKEQAEKDMEERVEEFRLSLQSKLDKEFEGEKSKILSSAKREKNSSILAAKKEYLESIREELLERLKNLPEEEKTSLYEAVFKRVLSEGNFSIVFVSSKDREKVEKIASQYGLEVQEDPSVEGLIFSDKEGKVLEDFQLNVLVDELFDLYKEREIPHPLDNE